MTFEHLSNDSATYRSTPYYLYPKVSVRPTLLQDRGDRLNCNSKMAKGSAEHPSPNFKSPPVLNSGPPVWSSFQPIWTTCSACLPPAGQLQDLPSIQHKPLTQWFNGSIAILDPSNHPYPNVSTPYTTLQSKRLGEYLVDLALVIACDAICTVKTHDHAWVSLADICRIRHLYCNAGSKELIHRIFVSPSVRYWMTSLQI